MEDIQVLDQLWYCCSKTLERTIYKEGLGNETSEADLLKVMNKMAVKRQNVLLNIVSFLGMGQDTDEPVKHFTARLRGQAAVCNFTLPEGTQEYTDLMVQHQLVRGLSDPLIQEQVLAHAATEDGAIMDLNKTINLIEAKESGKADAGHLSRSGTTTSLNRISDYRSGKKDALVEGRAAGNNTAGGRPAGGGTPPLSFACGARSQDTAAGRRRAFDERNVQPLEKTVENVL